HSLRTRQSAHVPARCLQRLQQQRHPHHDRHGRHLARSGDGDPAGPLPADRLPVQVVMRMTRTDGFLAIVMLFAAASIASAQDPAVGAGKVEIGGFPMGGTFFVGGDDDQEVNFNVYSVGANLTYYVNRRTAIEGELTISFGLAQYVFFRKSEVLHVQMPSVWSYFGNAVWFPAGASGVPVAYSTTA